MRASLDSFVVRVLLTVYSIYVSGTMDEWQCLGQQT